MNAVPETPVNEQFAENRPSKSITHAKKAAFAFLQECLTFRINRYRGRLDFNVLGNRCQYRHFSTGC
jgi:hypothetical protein